MGTDVRDATPQDAGEAIAGRIIELMQATGVPNGIGGVGLTHDDVKELAASVARQRRAIGNSPKDTSRQDIEKIFEGAVTYW